VCPENEYAMNFTVNINEVRKVGNTYFSFKSCRLNVPEIVYTCSLHELETQ